MNDESKYEHLHHINSPDYISRFKPIGCL